MPRIVIDVLGQRFSRLVVIARDGNMPTGTALWRSRCDCGNETVTTGQALRKGYSQSCGCLHKELASALGKASGPRVSTHGMSHTSEYKAWRLMLGRCYNERDKRYDIYGGRGITVCTTWRYCFEAFFAHVGPKPTPKHTLDRIETNGNYEPGNVRWATRLVQNNNKRTTPRVVWNGTLTTVKEIIKISGSVVLYGTVISRLKKGMDIEEAIT